jgi:L-cysteine S-thiosulfotransferase
MSEWPTTWPAPSGRRALIIVCATLAAAGCADKASGPRALAGADPENGLRAMERVGCAACHAIPGIAWPAGSAGASLAGFGKSPLISGRLPNQPDILVRFLRDAPSLDPDIAMPPMPLTDAEARDVAAYLYTLR